jgi:hypothetical protein
MRTRRVHHFLSYPSHINDITLQQGDDRIVINIMLCFHRVIATFIPCIDFKPPSFSQSCVGESEVFNGNSAIYNINLLYNDFL